MAIRCAHCGKSHEDVAGVRKCAAATRPGAVAKVPKPKGPKIKRPQLRRVKRQPPPRRKVKFRCPNCGKGFDAVNDPDVKCRRCDVTPWPVCTKCKKAAKWVSADRRICRTCLDAAVVVSQQAGSGYTPQGPLSDCRGRAKRVL